jgi:hypothetical protein
MSLFELFKSPDVKRLEQSGNLKGLKNALHYQKDPEIRKAALGVLSRLEHTLSTRDQIMALMMEGLKDHDPRVRETASNLIIGSSFPFSELVWNFFVTETDLDSQKIAARTMETEYWIKELAWKLIYKDSDTRELAMKAFSLMDSVKVRDGLCKAYTEANESQSYRNVLAPVLAKVADIPFLENEIRKEGKASGIAISALLEMKNKKVLPILHSLILDEKLKESTRCLAIEAITDLYEGIPWRLQFVDTLALMLEQHPHNHLGWTAAVTLRSCGEKGIEALRVALTKPDDNIRIYSIASLVGMEHRNTMGVEKEFCKIMKMDYPGVADILRQSLRDTNFDVRFHALNGLRGMDLAPVDDEEQAIRAVLLPDKEQIIGLGKKALGPLLDAIHSNNVHVKHGELVETLGEIGGKEEIGLLMHMATTGDRKIAQVASTALKELIPQFLDKLASEELQALNRLNDRDIAFSTSLDIIIDSEKLDFSGIRHIASEELQRRGLPESLVY